MDILLQTSILRMVFLSPKEKSALSETGTVMLINLCSNLFSSIKTQLIQLVRRILA